MNVGCGIAELQPIASIESALDVFPRSCGLDGPTETVTLSNTGPGPDLSWSAQTEGPFVLDGLSTGAVAAGQSANVAFHAKVPSSTARFTTVTGSLVITTNDPAHRELRVPLAAIATGAEVHFSDPVDLGETPLGGVRDVSVYLENKGDNDVTIDFGAPSVPTFQTNAKTIVIPANSSSYGAEFRFQPVSLGSIDAKVPVTYHGAVCGAPPSVVTLRARGVSGIAVSPGKVDFGLVDCGATAETQKLTLENPTKSVVHVKLAFAHGEDRFFPIPDFSAAPGTNEIKLSPKPIPATTSTSPNGLGDTLTITTDLPGDYPHVVALEQTAYGVVLSLPATTNVGRVLVDRAPSLTTTASLTNTGNAPAQVSGTTTGTMASFPATAVPANGSTNVTLTVVADPELIGDLDTRALTYAVSGPVVCGSDVPTISATPFDVALDVSGREGQAGDSCVLGHSHRVYCAGSSFQTILPTLRLVTGATGDALFQQGVRVCVRSGAAVTCGLGLAWSSPATYPIPTGTTQLFVPRWGNLRLCALGASGTLQCTGYNTSYEFGNGTLSGQFVPWQAAMTGLSGITHMDGTDLANLVVVGGNVYGAGSNGGNNGLLLGVDFQFAPTPVLLSGLSNVTRVSGSASEGAALHADGTVSLWDKGGIRHPMPGILDGVELQAALGGVCVIRQNGGVRCSTNTQLPNVIDAIGIATPAQKITAELILEANGAVSYWNWPQLFKVHGFEGP